jgi:lipopolysaccharide transport system ATP-binding protein
MNEELKTPNGSEAVITVRNLSKKFCRNLKRSMHYGLTDLSRNLLGIQINPSAALRRDEFWAVSDVSFDVRKGEILGIIGSNGSGKTTMLRLLTGIFPPDQGTVSVKGRIGALIALGAGFHPHMTGRENVFLNGSILGMEREEIAEKFDDIAEFAGIGEFIDAPVSTYSSGMTVRLGFAIAVHVEPEVLFVDEVLAVGDVSFRTRCHERMQDYIQQGNTICLVSHDLMAIEGLCSRVLWMEKGIARMLGGPQEVISAYRAEQDAQTLEKSGLKVTEGGDETGEIVITSVEIMNQNGDISNKVKYKDTLIMRIHYDARSRVEEPFFMVKVHSSVSGGILFNANMLRDGGQPEFLEGKGFLDVDFGPLNMYPGVYRVRAQIRKNSQIEYFALREICSFAVVSEVAEYATKGQFATCYTREGMVVPVRYEWGNTSDSGRNSDLEAVATNEE